MENREYLKAHLKSAAQILTDVDISSYLFQIFLIFNFFTFIWKKSVYWSSFAIWQEKSWDNITKQLGPCLRTLYKHSSQGHLLCKQSKRYSFNILWKGAADREMFHGALLQFSEFVTFLPILTKVDQILNYWGNYNKRQITTSCWGNGDSRQMSWLKG